MNPEDRQRLTHVEVAVDHIKAELPKKMTATKEVETALTKLGELTHFAIKGWGYGKIIGVFLMSVGGGWLLIDKIMESIK